jgi:hypothetical protein
MYEEKLLAPAQAFYRGLSDAERAEIDRLIAILRLDPKIDGLYKFEIQLQPVVGTIYDNGSWVITYRIVDNYVIEIWGIERADPGRRRRRR